MGISIGGGGGGGGGDGSDASAAKHLASEGTSAQVTGVTVETTLWSFQIPAATLDPDDVVKVKLWGSLVNNTGGIRTIIWRVDFGGTDVFVTTALSFSASANPYYWSLEVDMFAVSTSLQKFGSLHLFGPASATTYGALSTGASGIGYGTSAIDTEASARTLAVTVEPNNSGVVVNLLGATASRIPAAA